jgi:tRNA threonylcarbamoyladenosine biosynthesis protein TsaE
MTVTLLLPSDRYTLALGVWLGKRLEAGTVLLLEGDLGAGKTTLIKGVGKGLGISEDIDSPTFTLINEYHDGRVPLYHVDLYRLDPQNVAALYLETYWQGIENPPGIVAIEWSERLPYHPPASITVVLSQPLPEGRTVTLTPSHPTHQKQLEALTLHAILADEI